MNIILTKLRNRHFKMADLLGSILGSMEKPPSLGNEEKKKAKGYVRMLHYHTCYVKIV